MQIYLVGGAVRDTLLGLPVKDRDWVVVGATPHQLVGLGYLPVGKDFPVFLHPSSHEEYALARTERSTAPGYRGFTIHTSPDVTLEQDLSRRDLTINAIAVDAAQMHPDGTFDPARVVLTDPFHGQRDLQARVLRHVTDAFREDPVRILRVARFAARFADFQVAPETLALMQAMVHQGETGALVAERVWQELARGLMEATPSRMFDVLHACGANQGLLPELHADQPGIGPGSGIHLARMLDLCAACHAHLPVRFACLCLYAQEGGEPPSRKGSGPITNLCDRLRVPTDCRGLAEVAARERVALQGCEGLPAEALVQLLERCDAFRKPARFADLMLAVQCDARAGGWPQDQAYAPRQKMLAVLATTQAVSTAEVAARAQAAGIAGRQVGDMVHAARVAAVAAG